MPQSPAAGPAVRQSAPDPDNAGRLPWHRRPPRVQAEGMPGSRLDGHGGSDLAVSTLLRARSRRQWCTAVGPAPPGSPQRPRPLERVRTPVLSRTRMSRAGSSCSWRCSRRDRPSY